MTPVCFPRLDLWTILGSFYSLKIIELINENREEKKKTQHLEMLKLTGGDHNESEVSLCAP